MASNFDLFDQLGRFGAATALVTEQSESISYADAVASADALGVRLGGRGLAFLLVDNRPEAVFGYLAGLRSRTPMALLAAGLHPEHLAGLFAVYRPHHVWLPRERGGEVPGGRETFALGSHVLMATDAEPAEIHPDLAVLMTTSGSTGSPKLVRQSRENLGANAVSIAEYLEITTADRPITTLPMHYVYGLSVLNSHLARGAAVVLTNASQTEKRFWDLLRSERASSFAGVPYTYEVLRRLRFSRMDLPSLRVLTQAGGKLDPALVGEFAATAREKGIRFYVMYGAAEATARMSYLPAGRAMEKPSSIGIPIPGGELWLEDEAGRRIEQPGVVGELVYRGANVTLGYATRREDLALGDERGGVLRTGDLASRDEEGFFFVVGRRSRFLKIFGNRVNLEEVEQLVRQEGIDCACTGEDDRLRIYIAGEAHRDRVVGFLQERTGLHHSAFRVVVLDAIPRNEAGKISYAALP